MIIAGRGTLFLIALLTVLLTLLVFCSESATAAACKKAELNPKIDPSSCRPQPKMKKAACTKLIAKCRCQHNIIMKWVAGGGCPKKTPPGQSGCQCGSFCDLPCAAKCKKDKSGKCGWFAAEGKCKNRLTLESGPVPQCQAPTLSPTKTPSASPITTSPSNSPVTGGPSVSPTTLTPSSTPSTSPVTSKPSGSPTTSKPSASPTKSPVSSTPSTSPVTSKPSVSPSTSPTTSKPSTTPSTSPTTSKPSSTPSTSPTTSKPSTTPSATPTTSKPSSTPSTSPTTSKPSTTPSATPTTSKPSSTPSTSPTTSRPSSSPIVCLNSLSFDRIACGKDHSCAINKDKVGKCWGQQAQGRLGNNDRDTEKRDKAVSVYNFNSGWKIYTGGEHTCAITTSKSVYCWGNNDDSQLGYDGDDSKVPKAVSLGSDETAENMCLGNAHSCVVTTSGKVFCWGENSQKQCGHYDTDDVESPTRVGASLSKFFVQVACADESTCALTNEGTVYCWGDNAKGQLGRGTSSGTDHTPKAVSGLDSVTSIGAGTEHFCARVTCAGQLMCWGRNDEGQVGNGKTYPDEVTSPVSAHPTYSGIVSFAASQKVTCIVLESGKAYCWGVKNRRGDGSSSDSVNPTLVGGSISTAVEVACGRDHCCIRLKDESVKCFGEGDNGQLGNDNDEDRNIPVTVQNLV